MMTDSRDQVGPDEIRSKNKVWTSRPLNAIVTIPSNIQGIRLTMIAFPPIAFQGHTLSTGDLAEIKEIIDSCRNLSRTELASTICELFAWTRPSGRLKTVECRQFLERLEAEGLIALPPQRTVNDNSVRIVPGTRTDAAAIISSELSMLRPLALSMVTTKAQRQLWYEYVDRYHYLGYRRPFGAQLRYFVAPTVAPTTYLGCLQFSSPAWKMAPRDQWLAWDDARRTNNLQQIIGNSRFLIFPWIQVKNLASCILALALRQVADDWHRIYGIKPVLVETLVDRQRFTGTCYQAANWIYLGTTTGRGRMDRENRRRDLCPKDIYVYPLTARFRRELLT
jgi:hypothetical protein